MSPEAKQTTRIADITVLERSSAYIGGTILDESGAPVPAASVTAFTLTLFDDESDVIINARDAQSILNENGGTYHATTGAFAVTFASADNAILSQTIARGDKETHTARLTLTWSGGGRWDGEVRIRVVNLHRVP